MQREWKQQAMYELRAAIRDRQSVAEGYARVDKIPGKISESLMHQALLARDPEDGQNLMAYAARWGRKRWFLYLVQHVRDKLGVGCLVKQLRAWDINGTPLLFLAISSRSSENCFKTVYDELVTALGKGGLVEQIAASDDLGRNIVMYAARGNSVDVFKRAWKMYHYHQRTFASPVEGWGGAPSITLPKVDYTGRNLLHHAAEAGCLDVIHEILLMVRNLSDSTNVTMHKPDKNGLTPLHHLLRAKYGEPEVPDDIEDPAEFPQKFEKLWFYGSKGSFMARRKVMPLPRDGRAAVAVSAITDVIHAARGGLPSLQLILAKICLTKCWQGKPNNTVVTIEEALCVAVHETMEGEDETKEGANETKEGEDAPEQGELDAWGWGMLLTAAAKGGHVDVLEHVVHAIKTGSFVEGLSDRNADQRHTVYTNEELQRVDRAVEAIVSSGSYLFGQAVLSGKAEAVLWVYQFLAQRYPKELWKNVRGAQDKINALTCASSSSMKCERQGVEVLVAVYSCLQEAAKYEFGTPEDVTKNLKELFLSRSLPMKPTGSKSSARTTVESSSTPLAGAALSGNWVLFQKIYEMYERLTDQRWSREELLRHLPIASQDKIMLGQCQAMHECDPHVHTSFGRGVGNVTAVIWRDLVEAYQRAEVKCAVIELSEMSDIPSWRDTFKSLSRKAVGLAAERGAFDDLRELVKAGLPLHDDLIPTLLTSAEDEEEVMDIVMYAVGNASNPLVMGAGVSKNLRRAEVDCPMHRAKLRCLQQIVDHLMNQLLDKLPHTVRGMGMTLLRPMVPHHRLPGLQQHRLDTLANLAGYMVVEWILEPRHLNRQATVGKRYNGPDYMDPLQRALDRGSKALFFVDSPLVLDYIYVKFSCTLPNWASSSSIPKTINAGFYTYTAFDEYEFWEVLSVRPGPPEANQGGALQPQPWNSKKWDDRLLRFLQGWNPTDMSPEEQPRGRSTRRSDRNKLPHTTVLPMLQFSLAGLIGKPAVFYNVPAVRFALEFLHYLVMLGLFCACVKLQDSYRIPPAEVAFYVFMAGTLWREILEFCDGVPARHRRHRKVKHIKEGNQANMATAAQWASSKRSDTVDYEQGRGLKRVASAITRYLFYDTWNLLDTLTLSTVFLAFIFRLLGIREFGGPADPGDYFFVAQFFLAASAPLLFARLLRLSQIDSTLGPMIQIIWRMLSQTLRFGVFIVVVMAGFALAFNAVFGSCDAGSDLDESYGSFGTAFLTVFKAPLGEFKFEDFDDVGGQCPYNPSPGRASDAGTFLLVAYLVVLAVVMLNLLIAVLSTAHGEVYANGEKEFHLARTRLILQSARAVAHRRIPPPFNLVQLVVGFLLDGVSELAWWAVRGADRCGLRQHKESFAPITYTYGWHTFDGMLQRLLFASTMGLVAVTLNALLWVLSLPWVAWRIVCWVLYKVVETGDPDEVETFLSVRLRDKKGKFRAFLWVFLGIIACVFALGFAVALCGVCVAGSFVLWLRGVCNVFEWAHWRLSEEGRFVSGETKKGTCPTAMPGQERGSNWRHAWKYVAKARNFRIRHEHDSEHFHVAPLLQATTGLDMEQFCLLAKEKFNDKNQEHWADSPSAGKCVGGGGLDDLELDAGGGSVSRTQASAGVRDHACGSWSFPPSIPPCHTQKVILVARRCSGQS
ncbi:unnamed protein product [Ectocarpus sp. CCAP 1310/34]|nr:unnamed protein product [Ectocarpus sp. CCAP 1310/34]